MLATLTPNMSLTTQRFSFPESLEDAYTEGDCWILASEINRQAGLPFVALILEKSHIEDEWHHIANRLPDGRIVDILGVWEEGDVIAHWSKMLRSDYLITPYSKEQIEEDFPNEIADAAYPLVTKNLKLHASAVLESLKEFS